MFRLKRFRLLLVLAVLGLVAVYQSSRLSSGHDLTGTALKELGSLHGPADERLKTTSSASSRPALLPTRSAAAIPIPATNTDDDSSGPFDFDFDLDPAPPAPAEPTEPAKAAKPAKATKAAQPVETDASIITGDELLTQKPQADDSFVQEDHGRLEATPRPSGKPRARWKPPKEHFPVKEVRQLPAGQAQPLPRIQHHFGSESAAAKTERAKKQTAVREAFRHAWAGYKEHAYGHDELKPITNGSADPFNGWGATLVDALDTMWIMGLQDEFNDAIDMVAKIDFKTSARKDIPLFETTIRYLGGLLAAYDISGKRYSVLITKAIELADVMMGAFDTPNRMPITYYRWAPSYSSQPHRSTAHVVMAELGSLAIEFTRLSQLTGQAKYYDAIARVTDALQEWQMNTTYPGIWPVKLDASGCKKLQVDKIIDPLDINRLPRPHSSPGSDTTKASKRGSALAKRQVDAAPRLAAAVAADEEPATPAAAAKLDDLGKDVARNPEDDYDYYDSFEDYDGDDDDDLERFNIDCSPQGLNVEPHSKSQTYSLAARADSTYEYFPKMHALLGGLNDQYKAMYETAMQVIRSDFLFQPMTKDEADILFLAKKTISPEAQNTANREETVWEGSHLGCFAGGMVGLGAKLFNIPTDMDLAVKLTDACVWAYQSTPLGVMPESFELVPCEDPLLSCKWNETRWHHYLDPYLYGRFQAVDEFNTKQEALRPTDANPVQNSTLFHPKVALSHDKYVAARIAEERLPPGYTIIHSSEYKLRPEAIESVFIMYRLTGDQSWRDKGWKMFTAVEGAARTSSGHATVSDVTSGLGHLKDTMESFWLAETLKYYYLLFSDESLVSLDEWVFNTEAHPVPIPPPGSRL
ncbi:hypothetical protein DV736_g1506, partial [Chaetothyriales sp. CBS 134916]